MAHTSFSSSAVTPPTLAVVARSTELAHRGVLRLPDGAQRIQCVRGSVWITQDGDPGDVVLAAGEDFVSDARHGAVVYALSDARVSVRPVGAPRLRGHARAPRVWHRGWRQLLSSLG